MEGLAANAILNDTDAKAAARARDAERKRDERKKAREKKQRLAVEKESETVHEYWAASVKSADPVKLVEWKARQEEVEAQLAAMRDCMEGRAYDDQFILDVDDDTKAMLEKYGEAGVTPVLLIPKFWQEPNTMALFTKTDATSVFARYGILIGLPDIRVYKWKGFIASRRESPTVPPSHYVVMQCTACKLPSSAENVPRSIAERYQSLRRKFECAACRSKEAASRAASTFGKANLYQSPTEHAVFDAFGRVRDNG